MTNNILKKALSFRQILLVVFVAVSGSFSTASGQSLPSEALLNIVESRETARSYVRLVKSDWDSSTSEYKKARMKYDLAKAKYDAWVAAVEFAILSNTVEDLKKNKDYEKRCKETTEAVKKFADHVDSLPPKLQEKGILSILTSLFDIGGKIVDKVGDYKKKNAEATKLKAEAREKLQPILKDLAKSFRELAQWQDWNNILTT